CEKRCAAAVMSARYATLRRRTRQDVRLRRMTQMRRISAALIAATATAAGAPIAAGQPSPTAGELKANLERRLQGIGAGLDGVRGYATPDRTSADRIGRLDRAVFPTASTIKLAIVYELFKQVDEGRVRLDQVLSLDRKSAVGGSGVLFYLGTPSLSIRDYATLMVIVSDNTATNVLIDLLGIDRIAARMAALG